MAFSRQSGRLRTPLVCALALSLPWLAATAHAELATPWSTTEHTQVRLIAATTGTGAAANVPLGLHFRMAKGWKIYWRSPGDAGFPPRPDWAGSQNLASATLAWPAPRRFSVFGFETLGYYDEVVLPVTATVAEPGKPLDLKAKVDFLTCDEICIPYTVNLALSVPAGLAGASPHVHLVNRFAAQVPGDGRGVGITIERADLVNGTTTPALRITAASTQPFAAPDVFIEGPNELAFAKPKVTLGDQGRRAVLEVAIYGLKELKSGLVGIPLTLTLVDGARAVERALPVGVAPAGGTAEAGVSLAPILLFALLGGFLLNLMPCVLPVLSLKLLGVVGHGGGEVRTVRLSFLASAAGILASFAVLAGGLIAVKATGAAVGWGIQFQHPWFLIALTLVITLFACNLWGFFEIGLPRWIADLGEKSSHVHGLGGHFLTGAFATLLATPCSAPFLGTAVGFALARGVGEIVAVFMTLGLGLALPYLAVAVAPGIATRLPRPGPWIARLKALLGVALAATAAWLVSVLAAQAGAPTALVIALIVVAIGTVLWLRHRRPERLGSAAAIATAVLAAVAFLAPSGLATLTAPPAAPQKTQVDFWHPFDQARISALVAAGKTVFVDVTADWCLTCQVNKSLVLTKGEVVKRLTSDGVVAMQADWTRPNDAIARYLAEFGRYGIPFNAVYGPGAPQGIVLSEILTSGEVLAALNQANGKATAHLTR
jgi:suppressor for copper-sensitivity B